MAQVTKRPYKIPEHDCWLVIEDKYLVDYSEDVKKDLQELVDKQANMKFDLLSLQARQNQEKGTV
jgi:hypothetical protein